MVLKYGFFVIAFAGLTIAYSYFDTQSKLSQGKNNTDAIVQMLEDQDTDSVKAKLDEFVGDTSRDNPDYSIAINSIDYVANLLNNGKELIYVDSDAKENKSYMVFSAVYSIENEQGAINYLNIVMRRTEDGWILTNIRMRGDNPLA